MKTPSITRKRSCCYARASPLALIEKYSAFHVHNPFKGAIGGPYYCFNYVVNINEVSRLVSPLRADITKIGTFVRSNRRSLHRQSLRQLPFECSKQHGLETDRVKVRVDDWVLQPWCETTGISSRARVLESVRKTSSGPASRGLASQCPAMLPLDQLELYTR